MKLYGLTGGSGAGKSAAAALFQAQGWGWVDADAVYHALCVPGSPMLDQLCAAFGDVLTPDGALNRRALAAQVFSNPNALERLNQITLPAIWTASQKRLDTLKHQGITHTLFDAPTLFQSGLDIYCDAVIGVIAARQTRIQRIMNRDGLDMAAATARINAQPDDDFYRQRCQFILQNDGSADQLAQQVNILCDTL